MIFVIGGRGLVGSGFVRFLQARGDEFQVIDRANYDSLRGQRCDLLVNANGNSRKPLAKQAPLEEFDASVRSVRSSLIDFPCETYVHISSCDVYPDCTSPEVSREDQTLDPAKQSPYGFHKYLAEQCVMHAAPRWIVARCGGFVGPGLRKNAIFDALHGGPLWLDPASSLQFLHTDQAAEVIQKLAAQAPANRVYNVCGQGVISIAEVIEAVGTPVPVQPGSPKVRYEVSIESAQQFVEIPETRKTVLDFVRAQLETR